jgi:hypothetical protein
MNLKPTKWKLIVSIAIPVISILAVSLMNYFTNDMYLTLDMDKHPTYFYSLWATISDQFVIWFPLGLIIYLVWSLFEKE